EVAPDRPRRGVRRVRRAHGRAHRGDRTLALDRESKCRRGRDELDELAEERLFAVLRVVALGKIAVDLEELSPADDEAAPLEASEDLAGQAAPHRVRLDQDEGPLGGQGGYSARRRSRRGVGSGGSSSVEGVSIGAAQYGQIC